jgi:hypothetical protein
MEDIRVPIDRNNRRQLWAVGEFGHIARRCRDLMDQQQPGTQEEAGKDEAGRDGIKPDDL